MTFEEAAFDMHFSDFSDRHEHGRVVISMYTPFRELDGAPPAPPPSVDRRQLMGKYHYHHNQQPCHTCAHDHPAA